MLNIRILKYWNFEILEYWIIEIQSKKRCKSRVWAVKAGCTCNLTFYALVTSHLMEAQILCKSPIPECQNILERNYSFGNGLFFSSSSSRLRWSHWEVISSSFWKGWVWFGQPMASQNGCYFFVSIYSAISFDRVV